MSRLSDSYDVLIAGGGPAGASAAIHLALAGARVLLAEQKKFPRAKLCGEFISPECLEHFERLGVMTRIEASKGALIDATLFYSRRGKTVSVPSEWFNAESGRAVGLSRALMDAALLARAREVGVEVLEETQATGLLLEEGSVRGVYLRTKDTQARLYRVRVALDATGRTRALARQLEKDTGQSRHTKKRRAPLVAFKAHLEGARGADRACEIYFYRGGYGGLSRVENGLSNLCFIARARDVRACRSDPERVLREVVATNSRAAWTLQNARAQSEWLSVSLESFGRCELVPVEGLLTVGDAAAFIDPFTGSGMLMALEGGELAGRVVAKHLDGLRQGQKNFDALADDYRAAYGQKFNQRLRLCSLLRRAALFPRLADAAILTFGMSERVRRRLARATRKG
jgi:flavin-dependent dehydrogenase